MGVIDVIAGVRNTEKYDGPASAIALSENKQ